MPSVPNIPISRVFGEIQLVFIATAIAATSSSVWIPWVFTCWLLRHIICAVMWARKICAKIFNSKRV